MDEKEDNTMNKHKYLVLAPDNNNIVVEEQDISIGEFSAEELEDEMENPSTGGFFSNIPRTFIPLDFVTKIISNDKTDSGQMKSFVEWVNNYKNIGWIECLLAQALNDWVDNEFEQIHDGEKPLLKDRDLKRIRVELDKLRNPGK